MATSYVRDAKTQEVIPNLRVSDLREMATVKAYYSVEKFGERFVLDSPTRTFVSGEATQLENLERRINSARKLNVMYALLLP